jgi:dynactin complex subunit
MRLSPNGPVSSVEVHERPIVTGSKRGNWTAWEEKLTSSDIEREIRYLNKRIADMEIGFTNIRARRSVELATTIRWQRHAIKFNKLNLKLFRLRQRALPFGRNGDRT